MIFRHSLRARIITAFCIFGLILGIVYASGVYISLDMIDDRLIDNRLSEEVSYFIAHHQRYNAFPRTTSPYITAYVGTENMPLYVLDMITGLSEGFYEIYRDEEEYHIAIQPIQNQLTPLYLFYEVSALEFTEKRKLGIGLVLIAGIALIVGLGFWIGWLTSRKVIAPVVHLSNLVNQSGPNEVPTDLSKHFFNDEVGVLAKALEQAMLRVEAFVQREQRFGRYASHELRTPVTIIKGATVLLKKKFISPDDPAARPLKRIERSITNMESIIETLLWLAREDSGRSCNLVLEVGAVIQEVIDQNRYLVAGKSVDIEFIPECDPQLSVPAPIFNMMLTNLVRNAIQHTTLGKICITLRTDRVIVSDTGSGIDPVDLQLINQLRFHSSRSRGFGLGLTIVARLCARLGWRLKIESQKGFGTTANLIFRTSGPILPNYPPS